MSQAKDFHEAKQLFFAQFGNALVTNTYLKIALALVSLVALGLLVLNFRTHQIFRNFKPLVIGIDQIARAEAVGHQNLTYKPQDAEMKYLLSQFCKLHYATGPRSKTASRSRLASSRDNCWRRRIEPKLEAVGLGWVSVQVMRRTHSSLMNNLKVDPKIVAD